MKRNTIEKKNSHRQRLGFALSLVAVIGAVILFQPFSTQEAAPALNTDPLAKIYQKSAPAFDLNQVRNLANARVATAEQLSAIASLKTATASPNMTVRWNDFGGSPDVMYDFASQPFNGTAEEAARAFLSQNPGLFGISDTNTIKLFHAKEALGGHLVRFNQTFNGIPVQNGGIGVVMNANKQVIMVSGPFFRDVSVGTQPTLSAAQARAAANADLVHGTCSLRIRI